MSRAQRTVPLACTLGPLFEVVLPPQPVNVITAPSSNATVEYSRLCVIWNPPLSPFFPLSVPVPPTVRYGRPLTTVASPAHVVAQPAGGFLFNYQPFGVPRRVTGDNDAVV